MDDQENTQFPAITEGVIGGNRVKTVDGREVHRFLKVGKDYTTWMKERIKKFGFIENVDYVVFTEFGENSDGGRPPTEYHLTIGMGKELGMVDRSEKGRAIRKYFIKIEEAAAAQSRPLTLAEMALQNAQALVDLERRHAEQSAEIKEVRNEVADIKRAHAILEKMPSDCEGIERVRKRMNKEYRLSVSVVDKIMRDSPYAPTVRVLVRNPHAEGAHNSGFSIKEVSAIFRRFVSECQHSAGQLYTHPYVDGRFKLVKGGAK